MYIAMNSIIQLLDFEYLWYWLLLLKIILYRLDAFNNGYVLVISPYKAKLISEIGEDLAQFNGDSTSNSSDNNSTSTNDSKPSGGRVDVAVVIFILVFLWIFTFLFFLVLIWQKSLINW